MVSLDPYSYEVPADLSWGINCPEVHKPHWVLEFQTFDKDPSFQSAAQLALSTIILCFWKPLLLTCHPASTLESNVQLKVCLNGNGKEVKKESVLVVRIAGSEASCLGLNLMFTPLPAVWPWASYLTSLNLSFLACLKWPNSRTSSYNTTVRSKRTVCMHYYHRLFLDVFSATLRTLKTRTLWGWEGSGDSAIVFSVGGTFGILADKVGLDRPALSAFSIPGQSCTLKLWLRPKESDFYHWGLGRVPTSRLLVPFLPPSTWVLPSGMGYRAGFRAGCSGHGWCCSPCSSPEPALWAWLGWAAVDPGWPLWRNVLSQAGLN